MRKIFLLVMLLVVTLALPVSAEKTRYKDREFNFEAVKNFYLESVSVVSQGSRFGFESGAKNRAITALRRELSDRNIYMSDSRPRGRYFIGRMKIYSLGTTKQWHEPWTETKKYDKRVEGYQYKDGKKVWDWFYYPTIEEVKHPGVYTYNAGVELMLEVRDSQTGDVVYSVHDDRDRSNEDDTSGMLHRICGDIAKDLKD